ncbi:MAG: ATP-dependent DNA helicase [Acidobacteriota bacterium]
MHDSAASLESILSPGGVLAGCLEHYEYRPSQLQMAQAVLDAIEDGENLCVEAGTGTGKTLSYLIPALMAGRRVIVSTATKNLQEQIFLKDLPLLRASLFPGLKATYMKGRQNYLCLRRFEEQGREAWLAHGGRYEFRELLAEWRETTETGDRAELAWLGDEDAAWSNVDARSDGCTGQKCPHFAGCFVTRMRQRAFESDIIVVNHALFFANLALESDEIGRILPEFSILILDEAHDVEDVAADHFGKRLSNFQLEDLCRQLRRVLPPGQEDLLDRVTRLETAAERLFGGLPGVEGRHSLNFFRGLHGSAMVDLRAELGEQAAHLARTLEQLFHKLELTRAAGDETDPALRRVDRCFETLQDIFNVEEPENVYWFERSGRGVYLHLTPIRVAPLLREHLFGRTDTTVLTSATLTVDDNFEYVRERVGIPDPRELVVPGEFDYERQAVLFVPRDAPEPRSPEHFHYLMRHIRAVLKLTDGYAFLLFTSLQQMHRVYSALDASGEFPVLCQGRKPKSLTLQDFRSTPRAVLCATSSFWQGVDVQGEALRAVVIDKLPFHVPTEPLIAARIHHLKEEGRDPFLSYTVPSAIITLKQGLGRLIRSRRDTGILAVLDSRLWSRRYGNLFFRSLPKCPVADNIEDLENFFSRIVSTHLEG